MSMSAQTHPAMRLLSNRLRQLQRLPPSVHPISPSQARQLSARYSNPTKRRFTAAPSQSPSFIGAAENGSGAGVDDAAALPRNPFDARAVQEARARQRKHVMGRIRFAAAGLILSVAGLAFTLYNIDLDKLGQSEQKTKPGYSLDAASGTNASFEGKEVHVIGLGEGKRIVAEGAAGAVDLVETGTSSIPYFPKTMYLPTSNEDGGASGAELDSGVEEYTLIGLGIRSVSFLSIQVYVVGMYAHVKDISDLQAKLIHTVNPTASTLIPTEKDQLRKTLLDAETSREVWKDVLEVPSIKTAWRVVPTRNTDFMHLRDGWVTGINKKTAEAKKEAGNVPSEYDREDFGQSLRAFMSIFQGGKAPKGSVLVLSRARDGKLDVYFAPKAAVDKKTDDMQLLGSVGDERIGKLIWMNYLAGDKVSSEAARKAVADGCVALAGRPVGSVETMVA